MTSTPQNQPNIPRLPIYLDEILGTIALELAVVRICPQCQAFAPRLLSDLSQLVAEITRLAGELDRSRMDRANLLAAMRATLAAHTDGDTDPLWYLGDELDAATNAADASRGPR